MNEQLRHDALALLGQMQMQSDLSDWNEADGYLVESHDPESGKSRFIGPFDDERAAFAYRAASEAQLNRGLTPTEQPYEVRVVPLFAP